MVPPKSSILIGFSIIFTIHFGGKIPLFLETPKWENHHFFNGRHNISRQKWPLRWTTATSFGAPPNALCQINHRVGMWCEASCERWICDIWYMVINTLYTLVFPINIYANVFLDRIQKLFVNWVSQVKKITTFVVPSDLRQVVEVQQMSGVARFSWRFFGQLNCPYIWSNDSEEFCDWFPLKIAKMFKVSNNGGTHL